MESIRSIQNESVRKLAETLKQSGLAASETEAIRMATSMSNTGNKVQQTFEDRKDKTIMGLSHLDKPQPKKEVTIKEPIQETDSTSQASSSFQRKEDNSGFIEKEVSREMISNEDEHEEFIEQEIVTSEINESAPAQKEFEPEVVAEQKPDVQESSESLQAQKAPPRKNISEMEESKVNLSDVFNFSK